jgi:hypothetical protein
MGRREQDDKFSTARVKLDLDPSRARKPYHDIRITNTITGDPSHVGAPDAVCWNGDYVYSNRFEPDLEYTYYLARNGKGTSALCSETSELTVVKLSPRVLLLHTLPVVRYVDGVRKDELIECCRCVTANDRFLVFVKDNRLMACDFLA